MRQVLFTPWRYAYITGDKTGRGRRGETSRPPEAGDCFLCAAARSSAERDHLVVRRTEHHLVILNRYPYNSGHLMVAPLSHVASPAEVGGGALAEFWPLVLEVRQVLEQVYSPDGMNLGMNLGSAAGAGVPGHFHFHLVPRWRGDSNFMGVVGDVRMVPEESAAACERLREAFAKRARD